jgi:hypothetical protein
LNNNDGLDSRLLSEMKKAVVRQELNACALPYREENERKRKAKQRALEVAKRELAEAKEQLALVDGIYECAKRTAPPTGL